MRIVLSKADSVRWASGPAAAWQVEETVLAWAEAEGIAEPVVVVTHDGRLAFGFTVDRGDV